MKRAIFGTLMLSAAVMLEGKAPSGAQNQDQRPPDNRLVRVVGCLKSGSASGAAAARGSAGATTNRGFILTNAKVAAPSREPGATASIGSGATGATDSVPSSPAVAPSMNRFRLEGGSKSDFPKYANSQVEVTGRLDHSLMLGAPSALGTTTGPTGAAGPTGSGASATGSAPVPSPKGSDDMPTLRVSTVRQISSSCSAQ